MLAPLVAVLLLLSFWPAGDHRPQLHGRARGGRHLPVRGPVIAAIDTPAIDWAALSPYLVLLAGIAVVMLASFFARGPPGTARRRDRDTGASSAPVCRRDRPVHERCDRRGADRRLAALRPARRPHAGDPRRRRSPGRSAAFREPVGEERCGEVYALLLSAVGGMAFFVASNNLITLFLGLEWFSISLYILCAITLERTESLEAGLKYLIVAGSFGSAILLFGCALVFGATGEIGYAEIARLPGERRLLLVSGLAMLLVGLAFKASAAPFHQWTPDVYEGAPTPITAFMAAATKVAALVLTLRLLTGVPERGGALDGRARRHRRDLARLGKSRRTRAANVKRMLAYSSISHAGFLLMPIAAGNELGGRALLFYLIPYAAHEPRRVRRRRHTRAGARRAKVTLANMAGFGWERPLLGASMATVHVRLHRLPADRDLPGQVLRLLARSSTAAGPGSPMVGAVSTAVSVYYYLERHPRDVHAAAGAGGGRRGRLAAAATGACKRGRRGARRRDRQLRLRRAAPRHRRNAVAFLPFPVAWTRRVVVLGGGSRARRSSPLCAGSTATPRSRSSSTSSWAASAPTGPACPRRRCFGRSRPSRTPAPRRARPRPCRRGRSGAGLLVARPGRREGRLEPGGLADEAGRRARPRNRRRRRAGPRHRGRRGSSRTRAARRDRLRSRRRRRSRASPRCRTGTAARGRARAPCPRASSSSAAARSAASWRRLYARLGARHARPDRRAPVAADGRGGRRRSWRSAFVEEGMDSASARAPRGSRRRARRSARARGPGARRGRAAARRHRAQAERRGLRARAARVTIGKQGIEVDERLRRGRGRLGGR